MLESLPRAIVSVLAGSVILRRVATRYGMRQPDSFARRFVAGETVAEAIAAARAAQQAGLGPILDYLGEQVSSSEAATAETRQYLSIMADLERAGVGRHLSVKLSHLGVDVDRATSIDNLRRVFEAARPAGFFIRVDMEGSQYAALTFDAFETLWSISYRHIGIAIQAYLRRSAADVERMIALGVSVRLVKGAYHEPREAAFQHKAEVDASFIALMKVLIDRGTMPAIATHDEEMVAETIRYAASRGVAKDRYEFEMLHGVRRDLQTRLVAQGHTVNVYIPFGRHWFPYFMRRLGERPVNVGFVIRSLMKEKP